MQDLRPGVPLFIIHGKGTGALRKSLWAQLQGHPLVKRLQEEDKSQGGCTIAHLKQ